MRENPRQPLVIKMGFVDATQEHNGLREMSCSFVIGGSSFTYSWSCFAYS